eukprot:COSAG01_NODE_829_length_13273_cov_7.729695_4_plen_124_part_00
MIAVYIDYVAAFDSVSHKFIDSALEKAKASNKSRAMFRAMYAQAASVRNVDIDFTESYKPRTFAHHWRRAVAVQDDFDRRMMLSTKLLLSRVLFSPGRSTRDSLATQLAPPLPSSGRKRQRRA